MSDELVFYTNPMSRGRIVRWMLEEIGVPYRTEIMDYATTLKSPAYLAINPMGKIPAITHRGQVVTEVAAIVAYLADAFPQAGLAPPLGERADYYRWMFFMAGPFEQAVTDKSLGAQVSDKQKPMVGYGSLDDVLGTIEAKLSGGGFVAGDRFSAADLVAGSQLAFQMMFGNIDRRPAFADYVARLDERPARKRAIEIDDTLIAQAKAKAAG